MAESLTPYQILIQIQSDLTGLRQSVSGVEDFNKKLTEMTRESSRARGAINSLFGQIRQGFMMSIGFGAARMGQQFLRSLFPSPAEIMAEGSRIDQARRRLMLDTAEGFQVFARAMEDAGGDQGTMERGFNNLRRAVVRAAQGNETYARSLDGIGLSARDLLTLSLEEQFEAVAVAIMNAEDQTAALDATTRIFGERAGPALREIIEELGQHGLAGMTERVREQFGLMTTEQVQNLRQMEDNINQLRSRLRVSMAELIANPENMEAVEYLVRQVEQLSHWMFESAKFSRDFARAVGIGMAVAITPDVDNPSAPSLFRQMGIAGTLAPVSGPINRIAGLFGSDARISTPVDVAKEFRRRSEQAVDDMLGDTPQRSAFEPSSFIDRDGPAAASDELERSMQIGRILLELGKTRQEMAELELAPFTLANDLQEERVNLLRWESALLDGLITQQEAYVEQLRLAAMEAEDIAEKADLTEQYHAAAAAAGDFRLALAEVNAELQRSEDFSSELRAGMIEWANRFGTEAQQVTNIITGGIENAVDGISSGLARAAMEGKGFGDAMRDALRSTIQWIIQATIRMALLRAVMGAVGGVFGESAGAATPTVMGHADGGLITGPGGPRDDSILARLSNGEFVMPAHVVRSVGASALESIRVSGRLPAFADGGLVGGGAQLASAGGGGGGVIVHQSIEVSTGVQPTVRAEILNLLPRIKRETAAAVEDARRRRVEMKYD